MQKKIKRIPKYYDGSLPTSRQIRDLLPCVLKQIAGKVDEGSHAILEAWPEIVGKRIAKMTRAVHYDYGVLKVKVNNSTLLSLLVEHEKERLIEGLRKRFPKVKIEDILFQIG